MPLQATSGAASYDAFGGGVPVVPNYIEDVFSCFVYTGTSAARDIVNGIDLAGKGGLAWIKCRTVAESNSLFTTNLGANKTLLTDATDAQDTVGTDVFQSFNSDGFRVGSHGRTNESPRTYASWTFRKQPKFFDVVTYTGNSTAGRTIAHNLGSAPGCMIVKRTDTAAGWMVYHRSTNLLILNSTSSEFGVPATAERFGDDTNVIAPTSSVFTLGTNAATNANGGTYVAYIFAHDAGGFGLTGTDNVISCGSYTTNGSGVASVTLGYEPQWILWKRSDSTSDWYIFDTMRGWTGDPANTSAGLRPNLSNAENNLSGYAINATGFNVTAGAASATYIYIAIRRGPMKVPVSGTSVFSPIAYTGNSTTNTTVQNLTTSFAGDAVIIPQRTSGNNRLIFDKLRGKTQGLYTSLTLAEEDINAFRAGQSVGFNNTQTVLTGQFTAQGNYNYSGDTFVAYNFKRAPSFFDEVCFTGGTGTPRVLNHNLTTPPELVITKIRNFAGEDWVVHYNNGSSIIGGYLNNTTAFANSSTAPSTDITSLTSTTYTLNTSNRRVNGAYNYVAYLFATCAGVSKVGSYTGNGTTQTIDCGFGAGGARFVLIKRTDSTGDWYVYDTARGMTVLTDPYLLMNSTAAESATLGSVTTVSTGFAVNASILAAINTNAASYIFLAIA